MSPDKKQEHFITPYVVPVTPAENEAIRSGRAQWFVRKSVPYIAEDYLLRVFCCQPDGTIDTEFVLDRYVTVDPDDLETLKKFVPDTGLTLDAVLHYFKTGKRSSYLRMWHVSNGRPLTALGMPKSVNFSDFSSEKPPTAWHCAPFSVEEDRESQAYHVTCDKSVSLKTQICNPWYRRDVHNKILPVAPMDKDAEYCKADDIYGQLAPAPTGYILLKRRDGFPYKGQNRWLVRVADAQPV